MKTTLKVLPIKGKINILHMFTLHQCRVFHILLSNFSSDWVSVLSHKICDEFSPRRILQNIFVSATCLSLPVCESVCPCDSPFPDSRCHELQPQLSRAADAMRCRSTFCYFSVYAWSSLVICCLSVSLLLLSSLGQLFDHMTASFSMLHAM